MNDRSGLDTLLMQAVEAAPLVVAPAGTEHSCDGGTHSRLPDGRMVCWQPRLGEGYRIAVDAEPVAAPVPRAHLRRMGSVEPQRFWRLWTRAEVRAKLAAVPILAWIEHRDWRADSPGLAADPVSALHTAVVKDLMVTWGISAVREGGPPAGARMRDWSD